MMVSEYVTPFTQLSRYAPNDVDTDEKKQECFLNGLNDGLAYALEACDFENFQNMVDKPLVLENRRGILSSKSTRVNRAATLGLISDLRLLDLPSTHAAEGSTDASTNWAGICHPVATDDSAPQPLSDSKYFESECSKDPNN
jgi:hypothetical protein